ncbi:MAG: glutamate-cysteine ligase family protein [Gemmatimonadota bacterium]|nr:glutamate-cysteine ligase family protein [Gemmatimonadota bacterium]
MSGRLGIFDAYGVEIEYAIVDADSLDVRPVADRLLEAVGGEAASDLERGPIAWSNELALHVLELKTNGPAPDLTALPERFAADVRVATEALDGLSARLLPGGMHPWMDPARETVLWPHEYNEVYRTFDRIFGCSGHGWTNLQSVHVNLPFGDDEEFHRLHAAIRLVLPLTPALAASSPVVDGRVGDALDRRLVAYRQNSVRVPSVAGEVVPEPIDSPDAYEHEILKRIYDDLAPLDPGGILRHEWANARGAIPRFDRGSIEIRLLDAQECPTADLALVAAVVDSVRWVAEEIEPGEADAVPTGELAAVLDATIRDGGAAVVEDGALRRALRLGASGSTAALAWSKLLDRATRITSHPPFASWAEDTLSGGPLAARIVSALDESHERGRLREVYRRLCDCLERDARFE